MVALSQAVRWDLVRAIPMSDLVHLGPVTDIYITQPVQRSVPNFASTASLPKVLMDGGLFRTPIGCDKGECMCLRVAFGDHGCMLNVLQDIHATSHPYFKLLSISRSGVNVADKTEYCIIVL